MIRAERIVAALQEAKGQWVTRDQFVARVGIGARQVPVAILEARDAGWPIESHQTRGGGWRLAPGATRRDVLPVAPAQSGLGAPLSRNGAAMLAALEAAGGSFVSGKVLADPLGLFPSDLANIARHIMNKRPGIVIEGKKGSGYRLIVDGVAGHAKQHPAVARRPTEIAPKHKAHRAAIDLLQALHPAVAEKVRSVALEAGEAAADTIHRLLEYGIEVHHDLVASGQHPLQLRRVA